MDIETWCEECGLEFHKQEEIPPRELELWIQMVRDHADTTGHACGLTSVVYVPLAEFNTKK